MAPGRNRRGGGNGRHRDHRGRRAPAGSGDPASLVVEIDPRQAAAAVDAARRAGFDDVRAERRSGRTAPHARGPVPTWSPQPVVPAGPAAVTLRRRGAPGRVGGGPPHRHRLRAGRRSRLVPERCRQLFSMKARPADVPVPVLVGSRSQADLVADLDAGSAAALADRFWPGPLTLVVPRAAGFTVDLGEPLLPSAGRNGRHTVARPPCGRWPVRRGGTPGRDQRQPARPATGHHRRAGGRSLCRRRRVRPWSSTAGGATGHPPPWRTA